MRECDVCGIMTSEENLYIEDNVALVCKECLDRWDAAEEDERRNDDN